MNGPELPTAVDLTVALPVFNEEATLEAVVGDALAALSATTSGQREVLIVDDGSTDGSRALARALAADHPEVRLHEHPRNLGFAAVQRSCYREARHEMVFLLPADGQIDPYVLPAFARGCASIDLRLGVARDPSSGQPRRLSSIAYHVLVRRLFGLHLRPFGACLLVRRSLAVAAPARAVTPVAMTELVVYAARHGGRIDEVEIDMRPRKHGRAKGAVLSQARRIAVDLAELYVRQRGNGGPG